MNILKSFLVAMIGLVSLVYLLNPSLGFFELIPDIVPLIGNLDEGAAMTLILMSLRYFGLDITRLFERKDRADKVKKVST